MYCFLECLNFGVCYIESKFFLLSVSSSSQKREFVNISCFRKSAESLPHLTIIFGQSLKERKFPELWKKTNIVPVPKKEDKNLI